jgi:hypothetical protein
MDKTNFDNCYSYFKFLEFNSLLKGDNTSETSDIESFNLVKKFRRDLYCKSDFERIMNIQYNILMELYKVDVIPITDRIDNFDFFISESLSGNCFCNIRLILISDDGKEIKDMLFDEKCTTNVLYNLYGTVNKEYHNVIDSRLALCNMIGMGEYKSDASSVLCSLLEAHNNNNRRRYTYVMSDNSGLYKIGRSLNPEDRCRIISNINPTVKLEFYIEGDRELELHRHFSSKRKKGEWFELTKTDLKYIRNYNNIRKL